MKYIKNVTRFENGTIQFFDIKKPILTECDDEKFMNELNSL